MTRATKEQEKELRRTEKGCAGEETLRTTAVKFEMGEAETRSVPPTTLQTRREGDGEGNAGPRRSKTARRLYEKRRRYHAPSWPEGTVMKVPCRAELEGLAAAIADRAAKEMTKLGYAAAAHRVLPAVCDGYVLHHTEMSLRRSVYQSADAPFFLGVGAVLEELEAQAWDARETGVPCKVHFTFKYIRDEDAADGIYHNFALDYVLVAE